MYQLMYYYISLSLSRLVRVNYWRAPLTHTHTYTHTHAPPPAAVSGTSNQEMQEVDEQTSIVSLLF